MLSWATSRSSWLPCSACARRGSAAPGLAEARAAARAELDGAPVPTTLDAAEIYAMIDALGDLGEDQSGVSRERLAS